MTRTKGNKPGIWERGKVPEKTTIGAQVARKILDTLPSQEAKDAFRTILTPEELAALEE